MSTDKKTDGFSALGSSKYVKVEIQKTVGYGRASSTSEEYDIKGKVTDIRYYESLYSPVVSGALIYVDAGDSLRSNIPLAGNESLNIKIESKYGTLDRDGWSKCLRINGLPELAKDFCSESLFLPLIGQYEIMDKAVGRKVNEKFENLLISDSVKKILKRLGVRDDQMLVEPTKNRYDFHGKGKNPISLLLKLARKSVPVKGDPGFFFWETQKGFNFKSASELVAQEPKETYAYNGMMRAKNNFNDFKIMQQPVFTKDQDVMNAINSGTYVSRNIYFNPANGKYIEKIYRLNDGKIEKTLGKDVNIDKDLSDSFVRTNMHVLDVGSLKSGVSDEVNNNPLEWQAKSTMRYNTLHTQMLQIQVPCNLQLMAGDVVKIEIENLTAEKCSETLNKHQSGKYLILHLCHSFNPNESITSLTLIRDTYGLHTGKK